MWDANDKIHIQAELPGLQKDKVNAEIVNGYLHISGETTKDVKKYEKMNARVQERSWGKFSRVVTLPSGIDVSNVTASFNDGILEMEIPKLPENKSPISLKKLVSE